MAVATVITHPFLLLIANILLTNATAAYTHSRATRLLAFILSVFLSYLAISNWNNHISTTGWAGRTLAGALFTVPNILFDRLIIRNWQYGKDDLKPKGIEKNEREKEKKQTRWEWGQEVAGKSRYVGTTHEVSNVPFFDTKDPVLGPSKRTFCLQRASMILTFYFLNTLAIDGQLNAKKGFLDDFYVPWFRRIFSGGIPHLREEITTRVTVSLLYWVAQFCYLQCFFSIGALLDVGLGDGEVRLWRPLFGEARHACSIRGFWGKFWHQSIQLNIKGPAEFITHTILQIPRSTFIARYLKIFLAFAVSGAMHIASDYGGGISPRQSGAMTFFCTQALGIMIEDGVQEIWRMMGGKKNTLFGKTIGIIWTLGFLCWSTPVWVYPVARDMQREDMLLTLGAIEPLVVGLKFW
ncbi:hypothetical protein EAF04_010765 [Stromatinia cepivora]|nr:hypothetical protein EAF04_010765 [Stromatinia cepivora]